MAERRFNLLTRMPSIVLSLGVLSVLFACTATSKSKDEKICTAGDYVFCRCQDRQEGQKLCKADGQSFGACEPCESSDNLEGPRDPGDGGDFFPDEDGGREASAEH